MDPHCPSPTVALLHLQPGLIRQRRHQHRLACGIVGHSPSKAVDRLEPRIVEKGKATCTDSLMINSSPQCVNTKAVFCAPLKILLPASASATICLVRSLAATVPIPCQRQPQIVYAPQLEEVFCITPGAIESNCRLLSDDGEKAPHHKQPRRTKERYALKEGP